MGRGIRAGLSGPVMFLLACGDPAAPGAQPSLVLGAAAPGFYERPRAEPGSDGASSERGSEPERPPLVGTPVGQAGTGPVDEVPDDGGARAPVGAQDPADAGVAATGIAPPREDAGTTASTEPEPVAGEPRGSATDAGASVASGVTNAVGTSVLPADFRLAIIGSSTAAGDGASTARGAWAAQLEVAIADRLEGDVALHNLASGGLTSAELSPGSGHPGSVDAAIAVDPDLILVALAGSNDLSEGTTAALLLSRLARVRDSAFAAGIPVFFLSTAPKDLTDTERETLAAWASDIAQRFSTCPVPERASHSPCFIDVFTPLADDTLGLAAEYDSGDGIHINDAGHARIYALVRGVVEPYVCSRARCR